MEIAAVTSSVGCTVEIEHCVAGSSFVKRRRIGFDSTNVIFSRFFFVFFFSPLTFSKYFNAQKENECHFWRRSIYTYITLLTASYTRRIRFAKRQDLSTSPLLVRECVRVTDDSAARMGLMDDDDDDDYEYFDEILFDPSAAVVSTA